MAGGVTRILIVDDEKEYLNDFRDFFSKKFIYFWGISNNGFNFLSPLSLVVGSNPNIFSRMLLD